MRSPVTQAAANSNQVKKLVCIANAYEYHRQRAKDKTDDREDRCRAIMSFNTVLPRSLISYAPGNIGVFFQGLRE